MPNLFDEFRLRVGQDLAATDKNATKFMREGSMATEISVGEKTYAVGLVYDNREDMDKTYLYVAKPDDFAVGTIFTWTDTNLVPHYYLVFDEQKQVKNTRYNKYLCFECNVEIDDTWGYISGPRTQYINTQLRQMLYEVSLAKPVLIMGSDAYAISSILQFGGRQWRIIEKDNYSAPGLVYYSLEQFVVQKDSDEISVDFKPDTKSENQLRPGAEVEVSTEDGYFSAEPQVQAVITRRAAKFTVPYDTDQITIAYKTDGLIQTKTYKVVM